MIPSILFLIGFVLYVVSTSHVGKPKDMRYFETLIQNSKKIQESTNRIVSQ